MERAKRNNDCDYGNFNKVFFDKKSVNINQKLNSFMHDNLKQIIGVRGYLYYLQNIIFTAVNKNILAVVGNSKIAVNNVYDKYNFKIDKLVKDTWKNNSVMLKYFYIQDGQMNEVGFESDVIEKPNSKVIFFNEAGNKYTFENFVASDENITALEVCQSIACYTQKELVNAGSVVYIYGPNGTGKTHLVNAICNFYGEKGGKVCYMSADRFLRQYVDAVQKQSVFNFQDNILKNEVIIIDDIDDLIGKNGTLTEMKKLIEMAIDNKKYVILTSNLAPNQLGLESIYFNDILSNAMSLKINDYKEALKTQIAMNYICEKNLNVPISIVRDLAVNLNCNVRELKNYIKKLAIVQSIRKFELSFNLAMEILADDVKQKENNKSFSNTEILDMVAEYYKLSSRDLSSKIKREDVCRARNVAMYMMKKINSANFQEIGRILNRNHSTIISGLRNVEKWLQTDRRMPSELADLMAKVK